LDGELHCEIRDSEAHKATGVLIAKLPLQQFSMGLYWLSDTYALLEQTVPSPSPSAITDEAWKQEETW